MQLIEYYHRLQSGLAKGEAGQAVSIPKGEVGQAISIISQDELAELLHCTKRNVKLVLKKMCEEGWIGWEPGRGRGNRSRLTLLADSSSLLVESAKAWAREGQLKTAMELIGQPGIPAGAKELFLEWLSGYFGYLEEGEQEKRRDILRLPYVCPILTLDPAEMLYAADLHLVKQLFDTLVRFDPREKTFRPHVAHDWESSPDGRLWTFYLRKGVRFHHGREVVADDAVFSFERLKNREWIEICNGWLADPIRRVEALSTYVLQVELHDTNYMFLHYVSAAGMSILPRDLYAGVKGPLELPIGSGPFRVSARNSSVLVLDAFQDYFRERALLDRVELWLMPKHQALRLQNMPEPYAASEPQTAPEGRTVWIGEQDLPEEQDYRVVSRLRQGCLYLVFNMKQAGPQQDRRFREAVHLLLDREALARETGRKEQYPASGFLPDEPEPNRSFGSDPGKAGRLLAEAEYGGQPLHLTTGEKNGEMAGWIARCLEQAGIPVKLELLPPRERSLCSGPAGAQCYLGSTVLDEDMDLSLLEMYQIETMPFRQYFSPEMQEEVDGLVRAILEEPGQAERPKRIRELEYTLKRDSYVLFLIHSVSKTSFSPMISGISLNSLGLVDFKDIWFRPSLDKS